MNMKKVAEDIIFIKDNQTKIDEKTWRSVMARPILNRYSTKNAISNLLYALGRSLVVCFVIFIIGCLLSFKYMSGLEDFLTLILAALVISFVVPWGATLLILLFDFSCGLESFLVYNLAMTIISIIMLVVAREMEFYIFLMGLIGIGLTILYIYRNIGKDSELKKQVMLPEKEDELTVKIYNLLKSYNFRDLSYKTWGSTFKGFLPPAMRCTTQFANLMKDEYPVAQTDILTNNNERAIFGEMLQSEKVQKIIKEKAGMQSKKFLQLLQKQEEIFKITNQDKEVYMVIVKELIETIPKIAFNVGLVSEIGQDIILSSEYDYHDIDWEHSHLKLPGLSEAVSPILQSEDFQFLNRQNQIYQERLAEFQADLKGTLIGEQGEREVHKELEFFSNQMKILDNIRLEVNGQSVESDIICVAPQGVFVLEVKNLGSTGSYNITIDKDGRWQKVMKNGRYKPMGSVSRQNNRHLHGIEQIVNKALGNKLDNWIQAKSIVVFANDVVGIRNYSQNICVVRASEVMTEIRRHPICLDENQINQIATILLKDTLPPLGYEMKNWSKLLLVLHLEIAERTKALYSALLPYIELASAYAYKIDTLKPMNYNLSQPEFSLEDDISDYRKSDAEVASEIAQARKEAEEEERRLEEIRRRDEEDEYFTDTNYKSEDDQMWEDYMLSHDEGRYNIYR